MEFACLSSDFERVGIEKECQEIEEKFGSDFVQIQHAIGKLGISFFVLGKAGDKQFDSARTRLEQQIEGLKVLSFTDQDCKGIDLEAMKKKI